MHSLLRKRWRWGGLGVLAGADWEHLHTGSRVAGELPLEALAAWCLALVVSFLSLHDLGMCSSWMIWECESYDWASMTARTYVFKHELHFFNLWNNFIVFWVISKAVSSHVSLSLYLCLFSFYLKTILFLLSPLMRTLFTSHFAEEETKARRYSIPVQGHLASNWHSRDENYFLWLKPRGLSTKPPNYGQGALLDHVKLPLHQTMGFSCPPSILSLKETWPFNILWALAKDKGSSKYSPQPPPHTHSSPCCTEAQESASLALLDFPLGF